MCRPDRGMPAGVQCTRSGLVESLHLVHVAVVDATRGMMASHGDPDWVTVYRSAAKPFQAVPLVEDGVVDEFGITPPELALAAASHNGEPEHEAVVKSILRKVGFSADALKLGPLAPLRKEAEADLHRSGRSIEAIHNNCSGQHAAMLGLIRLHGWPVESYLDPAHPLQERMMEVMVRFTGLAGGEIRTMPDGCGMVAFGVPLKTMAGSFARLGVSSLDEEGPARVLGAMAEHPFMVGGTGRFCTELGKATGGRMVGKLGAEGVYCITVPREGLGIAVKVQDGGIRAGDAATVRVLDQMGLLSSAEAQALQGFRRSPVRNTLGEIVGEIAADFTLGASPGVGEARTSPGDTSRPEMETA